MKIAFTSDWHLGNTFGHMRAPNGINMREQDGYDAANEIVTQVLEENVDLFVLGGDLFHRHNPTVRSIVEAQNILRRVTAAGVPVYMVAGNHDASDILTDLPAVSTVAGEGVNVTHQYSDVYELDGGLRLFTVSHHGVDKVRELVSPVDGDVNILVSHAAVNEGGFPLHTEEAPREKVLGDDVFDMPWSAVLLGHIHDRHFVEDRENVFYSGSIFRRGFSDNAGDRGWTLVTVSPSGLLTFDDRNIGQRNQVDLSKVDVAGMSGMEVEDTIMGLVDGIPDGSIVRVKISNCASATRGEMRLKGISEFKSRMLDFNYSFEPVTVQREGVKVVSRESFGDDENFTDWVSASDILGTLDDDRKGEVISISRGYVQRARNKKLTEN